MILCRISRHQDLRGTGGLRSPGRWHHAGQPIIYLAESPAGALLEVCVHTSDNDVPPDFILLKIEAREAQVQAIQLDGLPAGGNRGWSSREIWEPHGFRRGKLSCCESRAQSCRKPRIFYSIPLVLMRRNLRLSRILLSV